MAIDFSRVDKEMKLSDGLDAPMSPSDAVKTRIKLFKNMHDATEKLNDGYYP